MMTKKDLEPIVDTYYQNLEKGKILGRRCIRCGHIEFPPYLMCNTCGCRDTEWVDLTDMKGEIRQSISTMGAFGDPDFREQQGDYWAVEIKVKDIDPFNTSLVHVNPDKYEAFDRLIHEEKVMAIPCIIQDEDVKIVVWQLDGHEEFTKIPDIKAEKKKEKTDSDRKEENEKADYSDINLAADPVAQTVVQCAAEAYGVDPSSITPETDIHEELGKESMKVIVMISEIEDELDATIEIQEALTFNTIGEVIYAVKEKLGM